jgi:hypothetical protein
MAKVSPFRIDILDASGNLLGPGPIVTATQLNDTRRLDKIGEASFVMPAGDPRTEYITSGVQFDIYDEVDGYLGRFLFKDKQIQETKGQALLVVNAYDRLRELSRATVGFRRTYNNEAVDSVIADLIGVLSGWAVDVEAGIGNTTVSYEGESPLVAIDELRDRWGRHYRLQPPALLEFGAFGETAPVRLTRLRGQIQTAIAQHPEVALVNSISLVEESEEIYNSIIPLGFGQGVSQLTIENATLGTYTVLSAQNQDGSFYYYIEDNASVAAYGRRVRVLTFPQIRPITNSPANLENAANALKLTAEAYIGKHLEPRIEYSVDVRGLRKAVKVGQKIRLQYRGMVENYKYIDVDQDFWIMDITRSRNASTGDRTASISITNVDARRTADSDVVLGVIHDLRSLKVHIPATLSYSPIGPYVKRIKGDATPANRVNPEFSVRIKEEVLRLNYAILRFVTSPLKSSASGAASGGGSTETTTSTPHEHLILRSQDGTALQGPLNTRRFTILDQTSGLLYHFDAQSDVSASAQFFETQPGGSHTHQVTIPPHTHNLNYDIFADTVHPQGIGVEINGVDVTAQLGGPWASSNAAVDVEVDITDILLNATGGFQQNHTVTFYAASGRGEIQFGVDMLVTIQPIAVT